MKTATYTLPAFWASALINGDVFGMGFYDLMQVHRWLDAHPDLGACLCCSDEPSFRRHHDAPEVKAVDCLDFVFPVNN